MLKRFLFLIVLSAMLFVLANTVAHGNPSPATFETIQVTMHELSPYPLAP